MYEKQVQNGSENAVVFSCPSQKWRDFGGTSPLSVFAETMHPMSPEARLCVDENTFTVFLKKGKFLLSPSGGSHDHFFLIVKGVIRGYMLTDGVEITTWITEEYEFIGSIRNLGLENMESEEYLQALEDCILIAVPKRMLEYMYVQFPEAIIIRCKLLERSYRDAEERAYISRLPSAEKRYQRFAQTRASLLNRIPLKYIASYLGMQQETLIRIRARCLKHKK
jgi:CRP-like cAMP-binding protein